MNLISSSEASHKKVKKNASLSLIARFGHTFCGISESFYYFVVVPTHINKCVDIFLWDMSKNCKIIVNKQQT